MSRKPNVTLIDKKSKSSECKIQTVPKEGKNGKIYIYYRVHWKVDGKPHTKQFTTIPEAEAYKAQKDLELKGLADEKAPLMTSLTRQQAQDAEWAIEELGSIYNLREAVEFFLQHHRSPEYTLKLSEAREKFIAEKTSASTRPRQVKSLDTALKALTKKIGDVEVHTVTEEQVRTYLNSLCGRDKKTKASAKTWNNRRSEISSFFTFAMAKDLDTQRPWTFHNPVENIQVHSKDKIRQERPPITVSTPETAQELLTYAMNYKDGAMAKYFAIAYFAGIRPSADKGNSELTRLSEKEHLFNLKTKTIKLHASMTKDKRDRTVTISDNLMQWLEAYKDKPIIPEDISLKAAYSHIRQKFGLEHDETRHSFISYYVALHRSIGDAALEAGNSESKVKEHYLNMKPREDGELFFNLVPDLENKCAIISPTQLASSGNQLKAI